MGTWWTVGYSNGSPAKGKVYKNKDGGGWTEVILPSEYTTGPKEWSASQVLENYQYCRKLS